LPECHNLEIKVLTLRRGIRIINQDGRFYRSFAALVIQKVLDQYSGLFFVEIICTVQIVKTLFLILFLGLFGGNALAFSDVEPHEVIRNAIIEQLLDGKDIRLKQETPVDVAFVKNIAQKRLGYNIVVSSTKIAGTEFYFESSAYEKDQHLLHLGVWVFSYRNNDAALRNAKKNIKGFCKGNCFRTKLLIFFSNTVAANKIIIIFTESSGDKSVIDFVKSAPNLFNR